MTTTAVKTLTVNGVPVEIQGERNLLEVIRKTGIELPTFCYHSDLSVYGACRLCLVEVEKRGIMAACSTPPESGMVIRTDTKQLRDIRKINIELLLANHNRECPSCVRSASCTLQNLARRLGVDAIRYKQLKELGVSVLVTQAVDESVAAGSIIRTDPAAGSQVAAGTTVVIYVSRPQVATTTKVPSLIGMNVNDARTLLVQRKLGLGSQTEQYSDQPVGSIISQNPGEGASAKLNTRVSVVVSAGPEPAPEPEAPSESTASSDGSGGWLGGLFGGSSSSSESTGASSSSSTGGGLSDWWTSWLG